MLEQPAPPESFAEYEESYRSFLREIGDASPTLREMCHLKGSAPVAIQLLQHTISRDADFLTDEAFDIDSVATISKELRDGLGEKLNVFVEDTEEYGMISGGVSCQDGSFVEFQLFANTEDMPSGELAKQELEGFHCQGFRKYLDDKLERCLPERDDPKDLYHLAVASSVSPEVDNYIQGSLAEMAKDSDYCISISTNLKGINDTIQNPDEQLHELLRPMTGKKCVSIENLKSYSNVLEQAIEPELENHNQEYDSAAELLIDSSHIESLDLD